VLFGLEGYRQTLGRDYDVASDGRFLMIKVVSETTPKLVLVENWLDEVERLVPAVSVN
jgi:predicted ester cyclase